ncbi:hypothetical protein [Nocardiopsis sp. LOL_012]|uniref:hypothetical protein n=1 Tax=Nocardiopsis sp. LOL_012 TaxID=3345409 RepID=UPI003A844ABF
MNEWTWCFEPEHLSEGLPPWALAAIERFATELAFLGPEADHVGEPTDRSGGLREFSLGDEAGFFKFILAHHMREVVIVHVTLWPH